MSQQRPFFRSIFFIFLLICLLTGLVGVVRATVRAAPMMQAPTDLLSLSMSVNNATPNKEDLVIFSITVNNLSSTIINGVTVQILLPEGIDILSDNSGGTFTPPTPITPGTWVVGSIGIGGSVTLNITTYVTTTGLKTVSSQIITSNPLETDPLFLTNNSDSVNVTPKSADLELAMSVDNNTPNMGDIVTFIITLTNLGPDPATGVRVNTLLPSGLTYISHSGNGTYISSTGNWTGLGTIAVTVPPPPPTPIPTPNPNAKTLTILASVTSTSSITNSAEVTLADQLDHDSTPANGDITEDDYGSVTLNAPSADLSVAMTVNNTTPNKADNVIFTITVNNLGPENATGVTVRDLLPAGLSYQSHSGGTYSNSTGVWQIGSLPAGSTTTLTITTLAITTGTKTNTASILTSNQADPEPTNNSASISVTPKAADLSIVKSIDISAPNPGDVVKFTITLNNTANSDTATNIEVKDVLPAGYSSPSYSGDGSYDTLTNIWSIASLSGGANAYLYITATVTTNPDKTNKAEVWDVEQLDPDSIPGNDSNSEDDDDAAPKADLSLTKTVNNAVPSMGSNMVFTLKVSNAGPATATGVIVRDRIPAGLTYVSNDGGASIAGSYLTWTVGTVGVGVTRTLNITMTSSSIGAYSNYAEIFSSEQYDIDSVQGNDSTTEDDDDTVSVSVSYPSMSILINEVAWAGTAASANDEWIELYNPGSSPILLTGWVLKAVDGTPTINLPDGYYLQPGEYYLLERTDDTAVSDIAANQYFTGDLGNSYEILQLLDPLNRVVDTANSNGGLWPAGTGACSTTGCIAYGSMERRGVMTDSDTAWITNTGVVAWGLDAGIPNGCTPSTPCLTAPRPIKGTPKHPNWAITVQPTPSPKPPVYNTPTPRPPVLPPPPPLLGINEFVPRPGSDWNNDGVVDTNDEYIEVINHGVVNITLSGYRLDDEANIGSNPYTLPNITLKPGERMVFYGSQTGLLLSDGGDGVRLIKSNGQLADAYNYFVVEFPDQSFCRLPDNGGLDDWNTNCFPTPGLRNSLSGSILRPPTLVDNDQTLCPIADTLPQEFVLAECTPFGNNIWNRYYWDRFGWYGERSLPFVNGKWKVFAE